MPNHVTTKMQIAGPAEEVEKCWGRMKGPTSIFDFEQIIPPPDSIKLPESCDGIPHHLIDMAEVAMLHVGHVVLGYDGQPKMKPMFFHDDGRKPQNISDEEFVHFIRCCKAIQECGYSYWSDWNNSHWGTKWNAYSISREGDGLEFQTAWRFPEKIISKLSGLFPAVAFSGKFADEDIGNNCGLFCANNGNVSITLNETAEFACEVLGYDYAEYVAEMAEC